MRVLLVDDDAGIRTALAELLCAEGMDVVGEGMTGEDAIIKSGELQPDVVVLDDQMPLLTGVEAMPGIRRAAPGARIVLFSAGVDSLSLKDPPDAVVAKGLPPADLLRAIAGLRSLTTGIPGQ